jgi:hypothetical protein
VGVLDERLADGMWTALAQGLEFMVPLDDGPTVVGAFSDDTGVFPEVLSVLPDPELVGDAIDVHAPRVA